MKFRGRPSSRYNRYAPYFNNGPNYELGPPDLADSRIIDYDRPQGPFYGPYGGYAQSGPPPPQPQPPCFGPYSVLRPIRQSQPYHRHHVSTSQPKGDPENVEMIAEDQINIIENQDNKIGAQSNSQCSTSTATRSHIHKRRFTRQSNFPYALIQPTFDPHLWFHSFAFRPAENSDNSKPQTEQFFAHLDAAIQRRLAVITPAKHELEQLGDAVNRVTIALEQLRSDDTFELCQIDAITVVGSFRAGTILADHRTADIVVRLRTLPAKSALQACGNRLLDELAKSSIRISSRSDDDLSAAASASTTVSTISDEMIRYDTERFDLHYSDERLLLTNCHNGARVAVHFTTIERNMRNLADDVHIARRTIAQNIAATQHAKWCDDCVRPNRSVIALIRLLKDIVNRFSELQNFNRWMISVISHYALCNNSPTGDNGDNDSGGGIGLSAALIRVFQLISAGCFLPYAIGVDDPIGTMATITANVNAPKPFAVSRSPLHANLSIEEQETLTAHCQTLFRVLNKRAGIDRILPAKTIPDCSDFRVSSAPKSTFSPERLAHLQMPLRLDDVVVTPAVPVKSDDGYGDEYDNGGDTQSITTNEAKINEDVDRTKEAIDESGDIEKRITEKNDDESNGGSEK